jgi:hypothetical protein
VVAVAATLQTLHRCRCLLRRPGTPQGLQQEAQQAPRQQWAAAGVVPSPRALAAGRLVQQQVQGRSASAAGVSGSWMWSPGGAAAAPSSACSCCVCPWHHCWQVGRHLWAHVMEYELRMAITVSLAMTACC